MGDGGAREGWLDWMDGCGGERTRLNGIVAGHEISYCIDQYTVLYSTILYSDIVSFRSRSTGSSRSSSWSIYSELYQAISSGERPQDGPRTRF